MPDSEQVPAVGAPPEYLRTLADYFRDQAAMLERRAAAIEERAARGHRSTAAIAFYAQLGAAALDLAHAGHDPERAARQVAQQAGAPVETVEAHMARAAKARAQAERAERDRLIVRLALSGMKDREIADRTDLARSTVNRIVNTGLREARAQAAQEPQERKVG